MPAHGNLTNFKLEGLKNYKFAKNCHGLETTGKGFSITWPLLTFQSDYAVDGSFSKDSSSQSKPKKYIGKGTFK